MAPGKKGKEKGKGKATSKPSDTDGILQELPDPITVLDISDPEKLPKNYKKSIQDIIEAMGESGIVFSFKDDSGADKHVPVTPGPDNSPHGAFVIEITDRKKWLLLVAEKHQILFRGIVTDRGSRYEIDKKTPKIMAGSKSLHTTAVYNDLLGGTVAICKVGYNPLIYSFHTLVDMDVNSERDHKTAIAVILVMLFESPRFLELYEKNMKLLEKMEEDLVGESGRCLINDWGDICRDFFEMNGNEKTITLTHSTSVPVKKVANGVRILCQTMFQEWLINHPEPKWKPAKKQQLQCSSSK